MSAPGAITAALPGGRVHFVGVGGIHMSALAGLVLDAGGRVSGSDLTASPLTDVLAARGARIAIGHAAEHVLGAALVVRTLAVPETNAEVVAARAAGIETITRAQMVARLVAGRRVLAVAGSHGKTTVATMLTLILRTAGRDPGYILGGESADLPSHAAWGGAASAAPLVLEADEYGRAFHHYRPRVALITNVEVDHLDYYGSAKALAQAFVEYGRTLELGGRLIVGAESPCAATVADRIGAARPDLAIERFGLGQDEWSTDARAGEPITIQHHGETLGSLTLRVPGAHNVRNALAAIAAAATEDVPFESIQEALEGFGGVRRRFQILGEAAGVLVIDDYAHHPTEIRATIEALRSRHAGRRLVLLFQPHTYSRSAYLLDGFREAFRGIDRLLICETYAAREEPSAGMAAADLAQAVAEPAAQYTGPLAASIEAALAALTADDVFVAMGAGDVEAAGPAVLDGLRAR